MLAVAWETSHCTRKSVKVYNFASSSKNAMTIKDIFNTHLFVSKNFPFSKALWYPIMIGIQNSILFRIAVFFCHYAPGILFDTIFCLTKKKHRIIPMYNKFWKINRTLDFFFFVTFEWKSENTSVSKEKVS